jgi:hypothetical protein
MDFLKFLEELDHGRVIQQLGDQLSKVVDAVDDTGQTGTLTVKFSLSKEGEMVIADVDATQKIPNHPMHSTLFFAHEGRLARDNPKQMKLKALQDAKVRDIRDGEKKEDS